MIPVPPQKNHPTIVPVKIVDKALILLAPIEAAGFVHCLHLLAAPDYLAIPFEMFKFPRLLHSAKVYQNHFLNRTRQQVRHNGLTRKWRLKITSFYLLICDVIHIYYYFFL